MFVRRNRILTTEISVLLVTDAEKVFLEKSHMMEIQRAVMIEHFISGET